MRKYTIPLALIGLGTLLFTWNRGEGQTPPPAKASMAPDAGSKDEEALRKTLADYVAAFNKGDLAGLGSHWSADAEYIDEAGATVKGRDAILERFKSAMGEQKGSKLDLSATKIRMLTADAAMLDGVNTVTAADGTKDAGPFTSVWVRANGKWLIHSARDLPGVIEENKAVAGDDVKDLEWLVGEWSDEAKSYTISAKWVLNKAFLSLEFNFKQTGGDFRIVQLFGHDPLTGKLKSWSFDSKGGYTEGLWTRQGETWVGEKAGVLPSGQTGTAVHEMKKLGANSYRFTSKNREVGGQAVPDSEVTMTRKAAP